MLNLPRRREQFAAAPKTERGKEVTGPFWERRTGQYRRVIVLGDGHVGLIESQVALVQRPEGEPIEIRAARR